MFDEERHDTGIIGANSLGGKTSMPSARLTGQPSCRSMRGMSITIELPPDVDQQVRDITARNSLSRPPHRKRSERGRASGSEGSGRSEGWRKAEL